MKARVNGMEIEYETRGKKGDPALILIMGLGGQLIRWSDEFVDKLVDQGLYVIRFDNRDVGLSTKCEGKSYDLNDMAADTIGVLDAEGVDKAHVVGASLGGMIAQSVAALYPERVLSLTSIFSTTGNPELPQAKPEVLALLLTPAPDANRDLDAYLDEMVRRAKIWSSPKYPTDDAVLRERVQKSFERQYYPQGSMRQIAAIQLSGDRRHLLQKITAPTMVIHGEDDVLVPITGGKDTAANIKGAQFLAIPGMGHDLPAELNDTIVQAIMKIAGKAESAKT